MESKMKDSGIPWIGVIPERWEIGRLKNIGSFYGGLTGKAGDDFNVDEEKDNYALFIPFTNIFNNEKINCEQLAKVKVSSNEKQNEVSFGDILFLMSSEDSEGIGKSSVYLLQLDKPIYLNSFCKGLHVINSYANSTYINYYMSCAAGHEYTKTHANGFIRINLRQEMLSKCPLLVPPLAEQERIAEYLDKKCGEIDELIDVEQQMISDLESYRQAVITETVTHGLNPNAPKKQSTIQGIKDIPFNWNEVNLLKVIYLRARLGWRGLKAEEYVDEGYPFLSAFNIVSNQLVWENLNFINQLRYDESPEIKLSLHDILIVKDGAGIGKCARVENMPLGESTVNSSLGVITVSETLYYSYLYYFFLSTPFQDNVLFLKNGMGVPHLTQENLKSVRIPLPPVEEQETIANFLDSKCFEIDGLIKVKQEKIETLKQYRQSLIFEAVTGKIRIDK